MSVNATYALAVDLTADGDYADANEDISAYWKHITVKRGCTRPGEHMAASATMDVTLNNASHKFSPQHASALAGFNIGHRIRLQMTYSATTVTLYVGKINHIKPTLGTNGARETVVTCDGWFAKIQNEPVRIAPLQNVYSGDVVTALLGNATVHPPIDASGRWGITGFAEPGTTLKPNPPQASIETGSQIYVFAGDTWTGGATLYGALRDICEAERGLCFEARDSSITFWGRNHFPQDQANSAVDATWDGTYVINGASQYSYGENLINSLDVLFNPRTLDPVQSVVASGQGANFGTRTAGHTKVVTLNYVDDKNNPIGALNIVQPVPGVDFHGFGGNSGAKDISKFITATVKAYVDRAEITFVYGGTIWPASVGRLQLRGQKFINYGQQQVHVEDSTSIQTYDTHPAAPLNVGLLQDQDTAEALATYIIDQNKVPRGDLASVSFFANRNATYMAQVRDRTIGDRISISEVQTGVSNQYWIIGETHSITNQYDHRVTYVFEPIPATGHWIAGISGYSEPGTTTIPG